MELINRKFTNLTILPSLKDLITAGIMPKLLPSVVVSVNKSTPSVKSKITISNLRRL